MNVATKYANWNMTTDVKGICWLTLDQKNASTNTLSKAVLEEFHEIINKISVTSPKALVIKSGKASGFIAGANINEFLQMKTVAEAVAAVSIVQKMFAKLSALKFTTVAMINGF
jgi:3-hydroxyacyl-CoA dehydrogenase/enoyl-CoA hydratase/3-hydroxybutyryl-CoA epimerase